MLVKIVVGHNLAALRKARGLTQGELAEKFNYTDKSISKWEHGETLPDIEVLKQLCDFYGVTLDYLVTEDEHKRETMIAKAPGRMANKWAIAALSVVAAWLVGVVAFVIGQVSTDPLYWPQVGWICFMWAIVASFIVLLVFNGIWGRSLWRSILVVGLTWSALTSIYLTFGLFLSDGRGWQIWPIFLIGIPLTVASILWNHVLIKPKSK